MTFGKKTLFSLLVGLELLVNILEITHFNFFYLSTIVSFCTCIIVPGFLISLILHVQKISFWENLFIIVGLSLAFLEFGGLLLNVLLPLFGIKDPLAFRNLVAGFDGYSCLLFLFAWLRTKQLVVHLSLPQRSVFEKILYTFPCFFPILAALGAIVLNNGGSSTLTLLLICSIAFYCLLVIIFRAKIAAHVYPYALYFIGLAALFATSLRSWYITGHDIEIEFYVFKLTNAHHFWSMAFFHDAYNACLSITILPTILTNLLSVQDMYVYKIIFQILFALSPVLVFFILRNYTTPILAFLSSFLFITFPTFSNDMAMLNRQEIGFIFFGLALYMMLQGTSNQPFYTKSETILRLAAPVDLAKLETLLIPTPSSRLSFLMRRMLFLVFGLCVIISHYSTNFVLLAMIAFTYISIFIISRSWVKKGLAALVSKSHIKLKNTFSTQAFLSLPLLLILFGATYLWNVSYTHSADHASSVVTGIVNSLLVRSHTDTRSGDLANSLFFAPKSNPHQVLQSYIDGLRQSEGSVDTYGPSITEKYPIHILPQEQLAPTTFGKLLTSFHVPVFNIQASLRTFAADFFQIFVFVGLVAIFFLKNKKPIDLQYLLLCWSAILLLVLITVLPQISMAYGALRMFQQFLFLVSLPIILGLNSILFFINEQKRILVIGMLVIVLFLDLTGFIPHLTGEYYPQLTLDNGGLYYNVYYVHKADVVAIVWLAENNVNKEVVVANSSGMNKLRTYGGVYGVEENFPILIPKNAYVYEEVTSNIVASVENGTLVYSSDKAFLDDNKNLVYSDGKINIYK